MTLGSNIRHLRLAHNHTQEYLANLLGYKSFTTIQKWETGTAEPPVKVVKQLSDLYGVTMQSLVSDDLSRQDSAKARRSPIVVNVLGRIPAGVPLEAIEDIIDTEELDPDEYNGRHEYFGLIVRGDSMYPRYMDGDVVIVQRADDADTGRDVVACVNGYEATLKTLIKYPGRIELRPFNQAYAPKSYGPGDEPVHILGFVRELRRKI